MRESLFISLLRRKSSFSQSAWFPALSLRKLLEDNLNAARAPALFRPGALLANALQEAWTDGGLLPISLRLLNHR